jgi:polyphenol oxidase
MFISAIPWLALGQSCNVPIPGAGVPQFTPDLSLPIRERKAVHQLGTAEVARLRLAYQRLRELSLANPTDPIGWQGQANLHNCYCGGGTDEVHKSFFFLPWHRVFLYFHERILVLQRDFT